MTEVPRAWLDSASRYAAAGLLVLPTNNETKAPLTPHGAKDATTDGRQLEAWATQWPYAGLGMALLDLVVIDVDVRDGKIGEDTLAALIAAHGPLPEGPIQRTRSGGRHLLFRARQGATYPGTLGADVDLKHGRNSYIMVEPSRGYVWLDELDPWDASTIIPEAPTWLERSEGSGGRAVAERAPRALADAEIARIRSAMRYLGDADREPDCFRVGMAFFEHTGGSEQGFGLWCEYLEQSPKFTLRWAREKWRYFARRDGATEPATLASVFYIARGNGWRDVVSIARASPPAESWPPPMPPGSANVPGLPARLLPGVFGEFAAAVADSTQTATALSVLLGLGVLAVIFQRRFEVAPFGDAYRETLSLWPWVLMASGERKSAVIQLFTAPLIRDEKLRRDRMRPTIAANESQRGVMRRRIEKLEHDAAKENSADKRRMIQDELRDLREGMPDEIAAARHFFTDTTAEASQGVLAVNGERFAVITDEGGFLSVLNGAYSKGDALLDVFLGGFSGSSLRVVRAGRVVHVDRPAVSLFLAVQPGIFGESAKNRRFRDSGLLARVLFAIPKSQLGLRDMSRRISVPDDLLARYNAKVSELLEGLPERPTQPKVLTFSEAARQRWLRFAQQLEAMHGPGGRLAHISDWTARLPGTVARIAALLQLGAAGVGVDQVEDAAMADACELARLLIPHAEAAFELLGHGNEQSDAVALFQWIWNNRLTEFSKRDAQRAMRTRFAAADKLHKALAQLQEWAIVGRVRNVSSGGRPSAVVPVNPRLYEVESEGRVA